MSDDKGLTKELLNGLSLEAVDQARAAMVPREGPADVEGRVQREVLSPRVHHRRPQQTTVHFADDGGVLLTKLLRGHRS
ncbi:MULTISPECIES: hypothetical protein [Streptomyces albovinaceus subgroup]|uniref:hypothetical protein n=1 Tax=Streptomyces TaxID=1883 RepID=UPI00131DF4B6|nr:hypothetical protein [Streptomyces mediolani]